jgi:hypothetical protein
MKLTELPPSIYLEYKNAKVKNVSATDTTFTVTLESGEKHRWKRQNNKWTKSVK